MITWPCRLRHRDHRDGHGAGHRVAQHRPVGRIARRLRLDELRDPDDATGSRTSSGSAANAPFRGCSRSCSGIGIGGAVGAVQGFIIAYIGVPVIHRHAGRSALDPRLDLVPVSGRSGDRPRPDLPAHRRWRPRFSRRGRHLDHRDRRLHRHRRPALQQPPAAPRYGFPLRPMWAEVLIGGRGSVAVLGLACVREQQLTGQRASPSNTLTPWHHRCRPAACRSRRASPTPWSCSSASGW